MIRVLVVDDDAFQLDLRKMVLEKAGHQVRIAMSPTSALRELERHPPDLIMMDLCYPNAAGERDAVAGIALIRRIRESGSTAIVVVLSGWPAALYGTPEEHMVARILVKPVNTAALLEHVRELATT